MNSENSPRREDQENEEARRRQEGDWKESPSSRPESDGEDFNQGGRTRARSEATGEDF